MLCPVCKAAMRTKRSMPVDGKVIREYRCTERTCQKKFMSEELLYPIADLKGKDLSSELNHTMYERYEKTPQELRKPLPKPPKKKRKVATKPSPHKDDELYLTYEELFKKFKQWCIWNTDIVIADYRPYALLDYSLIVWDKDGVERAYQYDRSTGEFKRIKDAKTYEEILNDVGRKRA